MIVKVYWNIHKNCWSVLNSAGRVIAHEDTVHLTDATFIVRQGGRKRVLQEQRKNVHAFVKGTLSVCAETHAIKITYNPYKYDSFVEAYSKKPIFNTNTVMLMVNGSKGEVWG